VHSKERGDTPAVGAAARFLVLIGSGELAPQMARVHRAVIKALRESSTGGKVQAAVIDTPFGFQENADALSMELLDFFGRRMGLDVALASLRRADADPVARELAYETIRGADFVFSGPGSPSYATAQWSTTEIPTLLAEKLISGGAVVLASAAAATLGRLTVPVYEIYKGGADPYWLPGLDVLATLGIATAVIPHWDNNDGSGHDTRFCFLGARRLARLERELPPGVSILGIDEHTALLVDINADSSTVHGRGNVTLRRGGEETVFPAGSSLPLEGLRGASAPRATSAPSTTESDDESILAARVLALESEVAQLRHRSALVEPLVNELLVLRGQARSMSQYAVADHIRDVLTSVNIEVTDAADGTTDFQLTD